MAKFLMPKDFYRSLLDSFFLAASLNCNAYLEFRVQQGIVRAKLSDTVKPGNGLMPLPNLSRPPPPNFRHQVNSRRAKEPLRKRLHAEIATPSPQKPSPKSENKHLRSESLTTMSILPGLTTTLVLTCMTTKLLTHQK